MTHAADAPTLQDALEAAVAAGATHVDVDGSALERHLSAPTPIVPLEPPPANALELGLLEIEEDVLLDEYLLARQTFLDRLRAWRATVDVTPLTEVKRIFSAAGVTIATVTWDGLGEMAEVEIDYALRSTRAVGATTIATIAAPDALARLRPLGERLGVDVRVVEPPAGPLLPT